MKTYKLKQPTKNAPNYSYWAMAAVLVAFMVYVMLIRPLTLPADKMPFLFAYNPKTHQVYAHQQKVEYLEYTGGAMLLAALLIVPVVVFDREHDYTMALMWANRNNIKHKDYMRLMDKLEYHVWRRGNGKQIQAELQQLVNKYKGKDQRVAEYSMKPEYAEDLQPA